MKSFLKEAKVLYDDCEKAYFEFPSEVADFVQENLPEKLSTKLSALRE